MLHKTNGIVLRSVKYGESSIVTTIFTSVFGVQTYMVQGVRSTKVKQNRGSFFQPGMLLELVVYQQPQKNMQRIKEFKAAYIYTTLQEDIIKNSISLFSVEVLLRLLPEHAELPQLFDEAYEYFVALDQMPGKQVANFPLFFIIQCSKVLGYDLKDAEPALQPGIGIPFINDEDGKILGILLEVNDYNALAQIKINADARLRLTDWCVSYLQRHTEHMGNLRSLAVLREILH